MVSSNLILEIQIADEDDILYVRQRTRQLALMGGLSVQRQTRLITAVSEITRNAIQYASGGKVRFSLVSKDDTYQLEVCIKDQGPGIPEVEKYLANAKYDTTSGIFAAKRLVNFFNIETDSSGTKVTLSKTLPSSIVLSPKDTLNLWTKKISAKTESSAVQELQDQNYQLIQALVEVQESKLLLSKQQALLAEHTAQLESANKTKSNFVANMSHEMRTPLNAIIGISDILTKTSLNKHQQFLVNSLHAAGRSLLSLINDILDLSKLEAGKFQIEDVNFSLTDTVKEALSVVQPQALEKYVDLMLFCGPYLPPKVQGDPHRLQQVLINIVANAIKFSSQNSETNIFVFNNGISENKTEVRFVILDTGIGISKIDQAKLFEAFSQIDTSANRKYGGSGLGLSICRHLVNLMNGEIGFLSHKDIGTAFWFSIPFICDDQLSPNFRKELDNIEVVFTEQKLLNFELLLKALGVRCKRLVSNKENYKPKRDRKSKIVFIDDLPTDFASSRPSRLFNRLMEHLGLNHRIENFRSGKERFLIERKSFSATLSSAGKALLVEDHHMNQLIGKLQLEQLGFEVDVCASGEDALRAIIQKRYSVVFMDCQMPDMDGYEVTREIRKLENKTGIRTPIIALTASALEGEREKCLAAGMDDYLTKPIDPEIFYTICKKWLENVNMPLPDKIDEYELIKNTAIQNQIFDQQKLKKQFTKQQYSQLIDMYQTDCAKILTEITEHFHTRNLDAAKRAAHTLQGASRLIHANGLANSYHNMEKALKAEDWPTAEKILQQIKR